MQTDRQDAIVQMPETGGRGVLVYGRLILTAAHCISGVPTDGSLTIEGRFPVKVETASGTLTADIAEILLASDIAVLRSLDDQEFYKEAQAFDKFCEAATPIRLCTQDFDQGTPFAVRVYSHEGSWLSGTAHLWLDPQSVWVGTNEDVLGGASGGPILTEDGHLVAIVSTMGGTGGEGRAGTHPNLRQALPRWLIRDILQAQDAAGTLIEDGG